MGFKIAECNTPVAFFLLHQTPQSGTVNDWISVNQQVFFDNLIVATKDEDIDNKTTNTSNTNS